MPGQIVPGKVNPGHKVSDSIQYPGTTTIDSSEERSETAGWNLLLVDMCSGWHTHMIRPHDTHTRDTKTFKYGYRYSVCATASKA